MATLLRALAGRRFRTVPSLEPVDVTKLPAERRDALLVLAGGDAAALPVVLRERGSGREVTALDSDTALLVQALAEPGPAPAWFDHTLGPDRDAVLARLVCDGVLDIEDDAGTFRHGAAAGQTLFAHSPDTIDDHPLEQLAEAALAHAAALGSDHALLLSLRLYRANAEPCTRAWEERLPDAPAVARWLGLTARAPWRTALGRDYVRRRSAVAADPWLRWFRRGADLAGTRWKIYVSPRAETLPATFARTVAVATAMGVPALKVGRDLAGVLRADKLILYLASADDLHAVARELGAALAGLPAQGVPFSAPLDDSGLLSWGVDPADDRALGYGGVCSWRRYIADRLGSALRGGTTGGGPELARFARQRLRLDGIEPRGWRAAGDW